MDDDYLEWDCVVDNLWPHFEGGFGAYIRLSFDSFHDFHFSVHLVCCVDGISIVDLELHEFTYGKIEFPLFLLKIIQCQMILLVE